MEIKGDPEGLKAAILAEARRDSAAIIAAAEAEAGRLLFEARQGADQELAEKKAGAEEAVRRLRAMMQAAVPAEAARERASRQEELLEAIKKEAAEKMAGSSDRARAAASLAAQALACMAGDSFVVTVEPADNRAGLAGEIAALCPRKGLAIKIEEGPLPGGGGAAVRDEAGTQRWDNSFGARLERAWPWLRSRLLPPEDRK